MKRILGIFGGLCAALALAACGSGGGMPCSADNTTPQYTVGARDALFLSERPPGVNTVSVKITGPGADSAIAQIDQELEQKGYLLRENPADAYRQVQVELQAGNPASILGQAQVEKFRNQGPFSCMMLGTVGGGVAGSIVGTAIGNNIIGSLAGLSFGMLGGGLAGREADKANELTALELDAQVQVTDAGKPPARGILFAAAVGTHHMMDPDPKKIETEIINRLILRIIEKF